MVYTQSHAANVQMLNNRFQRPWQTVGRRCAERFVCQIVGLQGREGPSICHILGLCSANTGLGLPKVLRYHHSVSRCLGVGSSL